MKLSDFLPKSNSIITTAAAFLLSATLPTGCLKEAECPKMSDAVLVSAERPAWQIQKEMEAKACAALQPNREEGHKVENWAGKKEGCAPADMSWEEVVLYCDSMGRYQGEFMQPEVKDGWFGCADKDGKFYPDDDAFKPTPAVNRYVPPKPVLSHHDNYSLVAECNSQADQIQRGIGVTYDEKSGTPQEIPMDWGITVESGKLYILRPTIYATTDGGQVWICGDEKGRFVDSHGKGKEAVVYDPTTGVRNEDKLQKR